MDFETNPNITEFDYDDVIVNDTRPYISPELLQFTGVTFICIGVFGTIANIIAIAAFTCSKELRSPPIAYMVNLSVSEMIVSAVVVPFWGIYYMQNMQNVDEPTTMGMVFLSGVVIQVVLHTVVAISVNRMIAIRFPHAYKRVSTWRAVFAAIGGIWLSGLLLWLPPILAYLFRGNEFSQSKTMFSSKKILGVIFQAIFCFFLPILVAIASYCVILFHIGCCHRFGGNRNQSDPNSGSSLERQPWKDEVTRTIFVVFVILLICGVPHSATHVLEAFNMVTPLTWFLIHILHNLQFIVDPIVYVTMSPRYRRAFAEVLKNLFRGRLFSERTTSTSSQASTGTSRGSKSQKTESTTV